ncbi:MAG TPA: hypothetical protein VHQ91_13160 [Geminicoccaceae bacterium]|nr:hypothetical protein [Geminicoccaceae bacterium]
MAVAVRPATIADAATIADLVQALSLQEGYPAPPLRAEDVCVEGFGAAPLSTCGLQTFWSATARRGAIGTRPSRTASGRRRNGASRRQLRADVERIARARRHEYFLGVDEADCPGDFATFACYHAALPELPAPLEPEPLSWTELEAFMDQNGARFAVRWLTDAEALQPS